MSKETIKLSLGNQEKLCDDIQHVQGVFELLFCALSSEHPIDQDSGVLTVVMDAQIKMKGIKEAVTTLTAA